MNEQDIPIDIHTGKLQEWLVSRRLVQKNWHTAVPNIRDKINNAIKDMPADDSLIKLLAGAHINYFHCLEIIEILKKTEADSKNVFGMYRSQRMIDWQDVVKLYERDSTYLAEAAQILVRNIQYEVPSLRKQITKFEQLSDESEKKIIDLGKSENIIRSEHNQLCQQLGIDGKFVRRELAEKLNELPHIYDKIAEHFSLLGKAVNLYSEFTGVDDSLSLIRHISGFGNTTVYQFLYNEAPISIETPAFTIDVTLDDNQQKNEIDFGGIDNVDTNNFEEINYDDGNIEAGNIDWGADNDVPNNNEIDFTIELEESGIVVEGDGVSGGVAKDDEAYTVLDWPAYRDRVLDELLELESFLKMRLYELSMSTNSSMIAVSLLEAYSEHDTETIEQMLQNVDIVISQLTETLVQHLNRIKHSPKYVDILADKLQQKLKAVDKIKVTSQNLKEKSKEFLVQAQQLRPNLTRIIEQTKLLQDQIEKDISKRYKNRVVNLMGGITSI